MPYWLTAMSSVSAAAARLFQDAANALETSRTSIRAGIAVTGLGSELGEQAVADACTAAVSKGYDIVYLGLESVPGAANVRCEDENACRDEMEKLLQSGRCDAAVTMHHLFPIGTATVGRVTTPARGKDVFIATTTGTPSSDRVEGLVLGALYGIIAAKSCGVDSPTVGILNIYGAHRAESALRKLRSNGFPVEFAESARPEGGAIMRGNDVLLGTADVIVSDPLTGNVLMKMLSAFNSGGDRECVGYGYGPGIGADAKHPILIISRASDTPVILNAIRYAADVSIGGISGITSELLAQADRCGLSGVIESPDGTATGKEPSAAPPKREPVTESISGIEIEDIDHATRFLWGNGIYAESGMGCTGPVVLVNESNIARSVELLIEAGMIGVK